MALETLNELPIKVRDISWTHHALCMNQRHGLEDHQQHFGRSNTSSRTDLRMVTWALKGTDLDLYQGQVIGIVGNSGTGKTTVLKLLAGIILPNLPAVQAGNEMEDIMPAYGSVITPPHLQVLHVASEPRFFIGSLYENLTFGVPGHLKRVEGQLGHATRVAYVCQCVGLGPDILRQLQDRSLQLDWDRVLSQMQRSLLSLARAFIADPDLLCIQKPTMYLHDRKSKMIMELLQSFVKDRGLGLSPEFRDTRSTKTVILTSTKSVETDHCDKLVLISASAGMMLVNPSDFKKSLSNSSAF